MIEKIERFAAQLETGSLPHHELFEQSQIPVLKSRAVNRVSHSLLKIKRARRRGRKNRGAVRLFSREVLTRTTGRIRELLLDRGRSVHNPVLPGIAGKSAEFTHSGIIIAAADAARYACLKLGNTTDLPSA